MDFPGATATVTLAVNDKRDIVGVHIDRAGFQHGSLLRNGVFISIDVPGAAQTRGVRFEFGPGLGTAALGVNRDGDIVGEYADDNRVAHGFLLKDGQYTTIAAPDAPQSPGTESTAVCVNSHGDIVGSVNVAAWRSSRGFLLKGGQYTTIEHPESGGHFGTVATGLNGHGDVVGSFTGASHNVTAFHGFAPSWRRAEPPVSLSSSGVPSPPLGLTSVPIGHPAHKPAPRSLSLGAAGTKNEAAA